MISQWITLKTNQVKLNAVLESHYANLYRIAYAWSRDESLAQDLVQDTMLKSLQKADQLTCFKNVERWLCKIMHNLFYDHCRHSARWQQVATGDVAEHQMKTESLESHYIRKQAVETLHDAMGNLTVDQREVVVLVDLQGFSYQEVADIINVPAGTVMSRLSRGRDKLKQLMTTEKPMLNDPDNVVVLKKSRAK